MKSAVGARRVVAGRAAAPELHLARRAEPEDRFDPPTRRENIRCAAQPGALRRVAARKTRLERAQKFALGFRKSRVGAVGMVLQPAENFRQRIPVVFRAAESIDDPLETQVKWNRGHIDRKSVV